MATIDDRMDELNNRVCKLEDKIGMTREEALQNNLEQYKMITRAVSEAINPIMAKMEKQDQRISDLENSEAKTALEEKKDKKKFVRDVVIAGIVTTAISYIVLGFLTNYASITTNTIRANVENEVSNNYVSNNVFKNI